jgi:hypothetical protein
MATVFSIVILGLAGYFGHDAYENHEIKSVATQYLNSLDTCVSLENFDATKKSISTDDFVKRNLSSLNDSFKNRKKKLNPKIDKILFVDRRKKNALEVCIYYTGHPEGVNYPTLGQLNLVLFKEAGGWKVQDAHFMNRSDHPIRTNGDIERQNQVARYSLLLNDLNQLLDSRMQGNLQEYEALFSEKSNLPKYEKLFKDEKEYLAQNNLKLTLVNCGLLVNSSTDQEALATVLLNQSIGKDMKSIPPLKIKFVFEMGKWKISDIYS